MLEVDITEAYNKTIDYIEYLASFTNPDGVKEMRKRRASKQDTPQVTDEQFDKMVAEIFGREVTRG
jgi:hypothetical protein